MVVRCILLLSFLTLILGCAAQHEAAGGKKEDLSHITFTGGSGDAPEDAIVINGVEKQSEGIQAEYSYISKIHGKKDRNWRLDGQTITREEKKIFDVLEISLLPSKEKRIYYFDVTGFPWKRKGLKR
ncbi:MAG: hypothetical protein JW768_11460 [Chitinispirillaceae bacterium]|nr:hypothetical protein [Chitinispirillaceae bacterium]